MTTEPTTATAPGATRPVLIAHVATLALAAAWLLVVGRDQWFFLDEWSFIDGSVPIWDGHNGHWSLLPRLLWSGVQAVVGLHAYWPYLLLLVVAHVTLAHLLWRVMIRARVDGWIATAAALVVLLMGAGSENLLWAFQFGFVGALTLGVGAILLLDRGTPRRTVAASALMLAGLATAGTALPLLVAFGYVALVRHGVRLAALATLPPAALYAVWFATADRRSLPIFGLDDPGFLRDVAAYVVQMLLGAGRSLVPLPLVGTALILVLAAAVLLRLRDLVDRDRVVPIALAAAAFGFAVLTAFSRAGLGVGTAASGRYVYVIVALALPVVALAVSVLVARWRPVVVVASLGLVAVALVGGWRLELAGRDEAGRELPVHAQLSAAYALHDADPARMPLEAVPADQWAPSLNVNGLRELVDAGTLDLVPYDDQDELDTLASATVTTAPAEAVPTTCGPGADRIAGVGTPSDARIVVAIPDATGNLALALTDGDLVSLPIEAGVGASPVLVTSTAGLQLVLVGDSSDLQICTEIQP